MALLVRLLTYLRAIVGLPFLVLNTVILSMGAIVGGAVGIESLAHSSCYFWGRWIFQFFGVKPVFYGRENLPSGRGVLLLFNHQSFFDIFILIGNLYGRYRFGAKAELFKIPFFGPAMRAVGTLAIPRQNRAEALRIYENAQNRFSKGWSFLLAPEGTRQTESAIGRFKRGPFEFAINAGVPVVPVVLKGTLPLMRKDSAMINIGRWWRPVHIRFLPMIDGRDYTIDQADAFRDRVRELMVQAYAELPD